MNPHPAARRVLPPAYEGPGRTADTPTRLAWDQLPGVIAQTRALIETEAAAIVPGLSLAVAMDGALVWSEQFGCADLATSKPATPATRFRIASISKPLTAAGLARLVERGQIDLDAPVQRYLPDYPHHDGGTITLRRLAGHLTGIRNYRGREGWTNEPCPDLRTGLKVFENDPLESVPGTKFSYCSYNWNVLGAAMEVAAGQEFLGFMAANVFKPLGLANTGPDRADVIDPQLTSFYETDPEGKFIPAPPVNQSSKWPSGGFLSTAEDLAAFGSAHLWPGFLQRESLQLLFTSQKTADGKPTGYGIGWALRPRTVFHTGGILGGTSILMSCPDLRLVLAILTNGSQFQLNNALRLNRVPATASRFIFNPVEAAVKIVKAFAPLYVRPLPN